VLTEGHIPYSDTQPVAFFDPDLGEHSHGIKAFACRALVP
jgi:hypothetical protein